MKTGKENVVWRQHPKYPSWIFMSWDKQGAYPRQQNHQDCCIVYTFYDLDGDFPLEYPQFTRKLLGVPRIKILHVISGTSREGIRVGGEAVVKGTGYKPKSQESPGSGKGRIFLPLRTNANVAT